MQAMQSEQRITEEKQRLLQQNNLSTKNRATSINRDGQNELNISGIPILFPFEPYDCQLVYMKKVIETLEKGSSSLLESPTGTGKTLSLLCSILGWRYNLQNNFEKLKQFETAGDNNALNKRNGIPNIIYSTRTHTQLNQVVQELKCTAYNPKVSILGSREQLCVHSKVSLLKGSKQNTKCRSINAPTSNKKCWFKQGSKHMDGITKTVLSKHILDVEDLHLIGKDQGFCPYYYSIDQCNEADIIFMPYNYLVNPSIRPPTVKISNSIIIFDEAHNIESVCCDSVSFELNSITLAQCISEVQSILELNKSAEDCMVSKDDLAGLKKVLLNFEKVIENIEIPMPSSNSNSEPSIVKDGKYIFEILKQAEITKDVKDTIIDIAQDVLRELVTPEAEQNNSLTMSMSKNNSSKYGLETFISALQTIFSNNFKSDSFKVHLSIKKLKNKSYISANNKTRTLSLWCFNPGIAISTLKNEVHAMILTSGTLSPLQSFSSELQIKFPIRLENEHLVNEKQIYVGVLEKGPCNRILSSEYNIRTTKEYMSELGNTLINIARRIPYGMLVFFASYQHMENCIEFWHKYRLGNLSIMEQLEKNKHVIYEPRGGGQSAVKQIFNEYSQSISKGGGILFAVMRGKVSEGMDFSDNSARCVIICGIPYPFIKDPKISAKREYMNRQCAITNGSSINGQQWYQQQAIRAVNQAIGRIIRHRFDYGCVILADRRFALNRNQKNISKWIKPYIKKVKNFGLLTRDLTLFFKNTNEFDKYMKKKKENNGTNEKELKFIKVKSELENNTNSKNKNELDGVLESHGIKKNSAENKFKRGRKRKYSDTLGKISQFVSSPMNTPSNSYDNNNNKRRKINIAYELNDGIPTEYATQQNNPNVMNISMHGNTPSSTQKLKRKMFNKQLNLCTQLTPNTQIENKKQKEINKIRARKLRIENSKGMSQSQQCVQIHLANKRRKKGNNILENIKKELTKEEYKTFKSVLKLLNHMKNKNDEREFDENIVTPFRALFCINIKRKNLIKELKRYIPKQFVNYYMKTLIPNYNSQKRNVLSQQINLINTPAPNGMIQLSMPNNKNKNNKKVIHNTLDNNYIKLRKLQDVNADLSQPIDKHKYARRGIKALVKNKTGYERLCCTLMSTENYEKFEKYMKDWRGINGNDINVKSNKKRVLKNIVDLFIENCENEMKNGNRNKFRSLTGGFDKLLSKKEDKAMWQNLILTANQLKQHMTQIKRQQIQK